MLSYGHIYSHTWLAYRRARKGFIRSACRLLGPFLVNMALAFSSSSNFGLTKIRVPRTWPFKNTGFRARFSTKPYKTNGLGAPTYLPTSLPTYLPAYLPTYLPPPSSFLLLLPPFSLSSISLHQAVVHYSLKPTGMEWSTARRAQADEDKEYKAYLRTRTPSLPSLSTLHSASVTPIRQSKVNGFSVASASPPPPTTHFFQGATCGLCASQAIPSQCPVWQAPRTWPWPYGFRAHAVPASP